MSDNPDARDTNVSLPLTGITVLDLTRARAGPTCVRHLADWGANVIYIQPAETEGEDLVGHRDSADFQNLHRNKRMIRLNLKSPEGYAVFLRLLQKADVIVENMRPAVKDRLRIAWKDVSAANPRIVYGSISGFGQDGPYRDRAGVDQIAQGMSGLMSITGLPGQGPVRVGIAIADTTAGNLLALAIMMALFQRERTGVGTWVSTSLLEAQLFMLDFQAARWLKDHEVAGQAGNDHPIFTPNGVFPTSDGYINISGAGPRLWSRLCDALDRREWLDKPEWNTTAARTRDRPAVNAAVAEVIRTKTSAYWSQVLEENGVPTGPIYTIDQAFGDPQVKHLGMARKVSHPRLGDFEVVASAMNFEGRSKDIRSATHEAGQDTEEVLREIGYDESEIANLRAKEVI